jgi:hypothetical protein
MKKFIFGVIAIVGLIACVPAQVEAHAKPVIKHVVKPELELHKDLDDNKVFFTLKNTEGFTSFSYELTYDTKTTTEGVQGSGDLKNKTCYTSVTITLGTCSSGTCVYHKKPHNFVLKVVLHAPKGDVTLVDH